MNIIKSLLVLLIMRI